MYAKVKKSATNRKKELLEKFRQIQNRLNRRQGINPRLKAKKEREKEDVVLV